MCERQIELKWLLLWLYLLLLTITGMLYELLNPLIKPPRIRSILLLAYAEEIELLLLLLAFPLPLLPVLALFPGFVEG